MYEKYNFGKLRVRQAYRVAYQRKKITNIFAKEIIIPNIAPV